MEIYTFDISYRLFLKYILVVEDRDKFEILSFPSIYSLARVFLTANKQMAVNPRSLAQFKIFEFEN